MVQQGLSQYVREDIQLIQSQIDEIRSIATRNALKHGTQHSSGQRIHALPRIARQLAQVEEHNAEYERSEREREKQERLRQDTLDITECFARSGNMDR